MASAMSSTILSTARDCAQSSMLSCAKSGAPGHSLMLLHTVWPSLTNISTSSIMEGLSRLSVASCAVVAGIWGACLALLGLVGLGLAISTMVGMGGDWVGCGCLKKCKWWVGDRLRVHSELQTRPLGGGLSK